MPPMPIHYALSEAALCIVATWGGFHLWRGGQKLGALGVMLFGIAAAIGIVRIVTGADEALAQAHRFASQAGGTFGLALIVSELTTLRGWRLPVLAILSGALAASVLAIAGGAFGGMVFLALLALGALAITLRPDTKHSALMAMGFALMAPNVLLVRQSAFLEPALSWHAYHLITALWLVAAVTSLRAGAKPR